MRDLYLLCKPFGGDLAHTVWHEVNIFDHLIPEVGSFYVMDRGYYFAQLHRLHQANSYFVIRGKSNLRFHRLYSRPAIERLALSVPVEPSQS